MGLFPFFKFNVKKSQIFSKNASRFYVDFVDTIAMFLHHKRFSLYSTSDDYDATEP